MKSKTKRAKIHRLEFTLRRLNYFWRDMRGVAICNDAVIEIFGLDVDRGEDCRMILRLSAKPFARSVQIRVRGTRIQRFDVLPMTLALRQHLELPKTFYARANEIRY